MRPKSLNCFLFINFLTFPRLVVSCHTAKKENNLNPNISDVQEIRSVVPSSVDSVGMSGLIEPLETTPIPPEDKEWSNSRASGLDSYFIQDDSICMDKFLIFPREDGYPGSRTVATIPEDSFRGNLVAIRCIWPVAVDWDAAVEISIRIQQSDWRLPCSVWNLTLEYRIDPEKPMTSRTVVCPREKTAILKIPPEAKKAFLMLTGLVSRSPKISLDWTYQVEPRLPKIDFVNWKDGWQKTAWGQLIIILGWFFVFFVAGFCLWLYNVMKRRRRVPPTDDEQGNIELEEFQPASAPPRSRPWTVEKARARQELHGHVSLIPLPVPTSLLTFELLQVPLDDPL